MKFEEFNLSKDLLKGILDTGYLECMPVQEETLASTLKGKDVCVQSQTGTGKTAAFLISIFQLFLEDPPMKNKKALIIVPTRELAVQIENEARQIGRRLKFTMVSIYGGVGYTEQEHMLDENVDIIIGTPGRLLDFGEQKKLNFRDIGILVIDEADRLFDMGFLPDIRRMIKQMVAAEERKTMLFSATLNTRVRTLAWEYMNNPVEIEMNPEQITVNSIHQELYHVGKDEKMSLLLGILKKENPENALIFTNMKKTAHEVAKRLEINGYKCQYIMGDLPQTKRLKIIEGVKSGKIKYLVATEVAARGLHIDDLQLVLNYDLPEDCENYVHRIGRTARAGKSGKAISLACERYVYSLDAIESLTKYKIPVFWPDEGLFLEDKSAGLFAGYEESRRKKKTTASAKRKPAPGRRQKYAIEPAGRRKRGVKVSAQKPAYMRYKNTGKRDNRYDSQATGKHSADYIMENSSILESRSEKLRFFFKERLFGKLFSLFRSPGNGKADNGNVETEEIKPKKIKASKSGSVEERMEYYRKKYGIDFVPGKELSGKKSKTKSSR